MNNGEFPPITKGWEVHSQNVTGQDDPWVSQGNGETLLAFDCPCNTLDHNDPTWENQDYDIHIEAEGSPPQACPRCGRLFKLEVAWRVLVYTPVAVRYPKKQEA